MKTALAGGTRKDVVAPKEMHPILEMQPKWGEQGRTYLGFPFYPSASGASPISQAQTGARWQRNSENVMSRDHHRESRSTVSESKQDNCSYLTAGKYRILRLSQASYSLSLKGFLSYTTDTTMMPVSPSAHTVRHKPVPPFGSSGHI